MANQNIEKIGNVTLDYTYYPGQDFYSEGAAEDRLLDFVENHTSSDYENYIQISRSWSVMYHLSHIRENVVSWLPIKESDTVLEVGSGCGAVTGAFARVAKKVTCVELSKKRSLINANRNKEFDNVEIRVGNFEDIEPHIEEKYDYITLIGVFEYAASYISKAGSDTDPYHKFLDILKKHLAPGGKIVIAIENRLGLKYFAGCKEDHLGQYFSGIMGYSQADGVRTFSRKALSELLEEEDFAYKFYYPYPDYKLPHTIYSDDKLPSKGDLDTNLRNFDADRMVLFDERKAFDTFIEEGLFPDYSNSFVVIASQDREWDKKSIIPVFAKYSNDRMAKYRVNTMIAKGKDGQRYVFKRALSTYANEHIIKMCHNYGRLLEQFADTGLKPVKVSYIKGVERGIPIVGVASKARDIASFEYISGISLEDYLNELEEAGMYAKMEELIQSFVNKLNNTTDTTEFKRTTGFDEMFGKRNFSKKYIATSPCNLDMIFSNIVFDKDKLEEGNWHILDYEWVLDFPVPIQFVVYRSLYYHFRGRENKGFYMYLAEKGMDIFTMCGIDIGERMLFEEMEHAYQVYIIGGAASLDVMRVLMPSATMSIDQLVKTGTYLRNLDTPKIYFSRAKVFSEDNQITQIGKVDNNVVTFKVDFDKYLSSIRIDPTEYPCVVNINSIRFVLNDGFREDTDSIMSNGYALSNTILVFNTNDPQIIIENIPADTKAMEVSYTVSMPEKAVFDEITKRLVKEEEDYRLQQQTISHKVKRKVGIEKREEIPEGFRRISLLSK